MTLNKADLHPGRRVVRMLFDCCHRRDAIAKRTSLRSGDHGVTGMMLASKVRPWSGSGLWFRLLRKMLIKAYGIFWRADEVAWRPGRGSPFRLVGRDSGDRRRLLLADMRSQSGIYVLYSDHGPYYVGLVGKERLGPRLRDHYLKDQHRGKWNRFSWFGFRQVLLRRDREGLSELMDLAGRAHGQPAKELADMEALLIQALGLSSNKSHMKFRAAHKWDQVGEANVEALLAKIGRWPRRQFDEDLSPE
jgi:hypothetical protein